MNTITVNKNGDKLLEIIKINDEQIKHIKIDQPLAGSIIIAKYNNQYLFGFNKWRKQWELPGGTRHKNEAPEECAIRELYEETGQKVKDIKIIGLTKIRKYATKRIEYYAVYYCCLEKPEPFKENQEMKEIMLWDSRNKMENIDRIDLDLIDILSPKPNI